MAISEKKKRIDLEILRIFAIFLVVFNHTDFDGFMYFWEHPDDKLYYLNIILSTITKTAVPIFFCISGAVLSQKEESIGEIFNKRVKRMMIVLIIFSFVYYVWWLYFYDIPEGFRLHFFIEKLVTDGFGKYWYLYAYLSLLLLLPMLRKLCRSLSDKEFVYIFILAVAFSGVRPILQMIFFQNEAFLNANFRMFFAEILNWNFLYFLLGYFIEYRLEDEFYRKRNIIYLCLCSFIALISCCYMVRYQAGYVTNFDETFLCNFVIIPTFTIIVTVKYFVKKISHLYAGGGYDSISGKCDIWNLSVRRYF